MKTFSMRERRLGIERAFSLVEVVLALGICSFALLAIIGLFTVGLQTGKESEDQIQAANMVSLLISTRMASPTSSNGVLANFGIPSSAMTNAYGMAFGNGASLTNYIGLDGRLSSVDNATYLISCRAGTNALTGPSMAQVYVMLSWPVRMNPTNSTAGRYEAMAYIPLR